MIVFIVKMSETSNAHVICTAFDREDAKRKAQKWLGSSELYADTRQFGNPDHYIVTPLTSDGDRVHLDITVSV